jgi:putative transposase
MMVGLNDRQIIVAEVLAAVKAGASKKNACETIGLNIRTFQRWFYCSHVQSDQRPIIDREEPKNKFSSSECQTILDCCNSAEYASSPPGQIVPSLADKGIYIGSESSLYRVLKAEKQLQHRGRSKPKKASKKPTSYTATGANQVWSWDISYLPTPVIGQHYYLYLFMDIYSRKIVGAEVFAQESGEDAADLLQRSVWKETCAGQNLVLHSDNGAPMKSFTLRAKMQDLGIITSRSRPRVSNDNPYSEAAYKISRPQATEFSEQPQLLTTFFTFNHVLELVLNIAPYDFFTGIANRFHKIALRPQFSSPKILLLDFREQTKKLSC